MGSTKSFKQWIKGKQNNNHKLATGNYLSNLSESIDKDTKERLKKLKKRSIVVELSEDLLETANLTGLTVTRSSLIDARDGEQISLYRQQDRSKVANGIILKVDPTEVKIKIDRVLKEAKLIIEFDNQDVLERRKRVENSFWRLRDLTFSSAIYRCLLGHYSDSLNTKYSEARAFFMKDFVRLKGRQLDAIEQSLKKRIFLVEGAAGSGKTVVAANIACSATKLREAKILLCSPIQATVNKLSHLISRDECIQVVQLPSCEDKPLRYDRYVPEVAVINRRSIHSENVHADLDRLVDKAIYEMSLKRLRRTSAYESVKKIDSDEKRATRMVANSSTWLRRKYERKILLEADIVCCTLVQSGSPLLRNIKFDMLIIDDAHYASELECIIPMMTKGLRQVTLLGEMRRDILLARSRRQPQDELEEIYEDIDPTSRRSKTLMRRKRVVPANKVDQLRELGGLFERWLFMGLTSIALKYQYRMQEIVASFSNHQFYMSRLKYDQAINKELIDRLKKDLMNDGSSELDWLPKKNCSTALFNRQDNENNDIYATVGHIIQKLGVWNSRIAIISNIRVIGSMCQSFHGVQIGQVDEFYGQERDYIIVLALEAEGGNDGFSETWNSQCNFLKNDLSLNIAITRARLGLFIVADLAKLIPHNSDQPIGAPNSTTGSTPDYCRTWHELVHHYSVNKLLVR